MTDRISNPVLLFAVFGAILAAASPAPACNSPLILDLNNDGIQTTSLSWPVSFDIDGNGETEVTAWTLPQSEDALLWLDLNHNGRVDSGLELFGTATLMPDGSFARQGFEALAVYDSRDLGGNSDGMISSRDLIWMHLLLWVDRNHDGRTGRGEVSRLGDHSIVALGLDYREALAYDNALNLHLYLGAFTRAVWPQIDIRPPSERQPMLRTQDLHDVFFQAQKEEP